MATSLFRETGKSACLQFSASTADYSRCDKAGPHKEALSGGQNARPGPLVPPGTDNPPPSSPRASARVQSARPAATPDVAHLVPVGPQREVWAQDLASTVQQTYNVAHT